MKESHRTLQLRNWLFTLGNNYVVNAEKLGGNIYILSTVIHDMFNVENPEYSYENQGVFIRNSKSIVSDLNIIQITDSIRDKEYDYKRQIFFIFTSDLISNISDKSIFSNKSDRKNYSDWKQQAIRTLEDNRIDYIRSTFPPMIPTMVSPTKTTQPATVNKVDKSITLIATSPLRNPTTTLSTNSSAYPLLYLAGIQPSFENVENCDKINSLLSELVHLHSSHNRNMSFKHTGNSKPAMLVSIPRAKNYVTYEKNERREKWLARIIKFISDTNKDDNSSDDNVVSWVLKDVRKYYPKIFVQSAIDAGLHVIQKMSAVEAAAMWVDANVSFSAARIIIRHLTSVFKHRIQVPFSQIEQLGDVVSRIQPVFNEFIYRKDGDEKVGEKIKYWHYNIADLLKEDFERLLKSDPQTHTSYGYESNAFKRDKQGVFVIIGADHGGGKSRYLVRTNLLDSNSRRLNKKADHGTRTLQFCEIACKKDVYPIQQKIAPIINNAKEEIENSMLVVIKNESNDVECVFIPNTSSDLLTINRSDKVFLQYQNNGIIEETSLGLSPEVKSKAWILIPSFKMVVAGDLSFFATCTGRDGRSNCRCTYCYLTPSEWSQQSSSTIDKSATLTLSNLQHYASLHQESIDNPNFKPDTKGVIMVPLLDFEPCDYITPLLHLLIGIVNKGWCSLGHFLDEFVENVSDTEAEIKDNILKLKEELHHLIEEIDIHTVNKNIALSEKSTETEAKEIGSIASAALTSLNKTKKNVTMELRLYKSKL